MSSEKINIDVNDLESTSILEFFELDVSAYGQGLFRFHPGTNGIHTNIFWQGEEYMAMPVELEEMSTRGDGRMPRPILSIANIDGYISRIINGYDDLVGLKIKRKRTFLKYLDAVNFVGSENPYGIPDPDSHFVDDIFIVNQKTAENKDVVTFELSSPIELENVMLPARQVLASFCPWVYRGAGCNYNGAPVATEKDLLFYGSSTGSLNLPREQYDPENLEVWKNTGVYQSGDVVYYKSLNGLSDIFFVCTPTGQYVSGSNPNFDKINWKTDQCSRSVYGCMLRFSGQADVRGIPFGGFPGTYTFNLQ